VPSTPARHATCGLIVSERLLNTNLQHLYFAGTTILEPKKHYFRTLVIDAKNETLYVGAA
jgi:hypothetical protein